MKYGNLYPDQIIDHYKRPRNQGALKNPDLSEGIFNPLCGDEVLMQASFEGGCIKECVFQAKGCVISQAAASLVTEFVKRKTVDEVLSLTAQDIMNLIQIELGPNRMRCALIAWEAVQNGLKKKR